MSEVDELLIAALRTLPPKPGDSSKQSEKKAYSEKVSKVAATAFAAALRDRGLKEARPNEPGATDASGAERRMAGGIGAKKVDVTWSTEESGLLLALSVKSINFRDNATKNFQKNLINRRGDMLFEGVTLHRRFPYVVLGGLIFLDKDAANDGTTKRRSTFLNAHNRLRMFTGRTDPAGRDEQFEKLCLLLLDTSGSDPVVTSYNVGDATTAVTLSSVVDELLRLVAERNPDFYEYEAGKLKRASG